MNSQRENEYGHLPDYGHHTHCSTVPLDVLDATKCCGRDFPPLPQSTRGSRRIHASTTSPLPLLLLLFPPAPCRRRRLWPLAASPVVVRGAPPLLQGWCKVVVTLLHRLKHSQSIAAMGTAHTTLQQRRAGARARALHAAERGAICSLRRAQLNPPSTGMRR